MRREPAVDPGAEPSASGSDAQDETARRDDPPEPSTTYTALTRRSFVLKAITILGALAAAVVAVPAAAFVSAPGWLSDARRRLLSHTLSPALRSEEWTSVGSIDRLPLGQPQHVVVEREVVDGWVRRVASVGVFVLRESDTQATVLDPHCTHLGCPIEFSSGSGSFLCPCHGGSFDPEGHPIAGPPPRRLDVYETRVRDGEVIFRDLLDQEP